MRKKNLNLSLTTTPSQAYLHTTIALHSLASLLSLGLDTSIGQHFLCLCGIALSLCYQLKIYWRHSCVQQIDLDGSSVRVRYCDRQSKLREDTGELIPKIWILPYLSLLYFHSQENGKQSLPIFADAVCKDDFRKLRIFALRGPLLRKSTQESANSAR